MKNHPDALDLERYAYDGLGVDASARASEHLATCADCRQTADRFSTERRRLTAAFAPDSEPLPALRLPARPRVRHGWMDRAAGLLVAAGLGALLFIHARTSTDEPSLAASPPGWQIPVELQADAVNDSLVLMDLLRSAGGTLCVLAQGPEGGRLFLREPGSETWKTLDVPEWRFGYTFDAVIEGETLHVLSAYRRGRERPVLIRFDLRRVRAEDRRTLPPPDNVPSHVRLRTHAGRWVAILGMDDARLLVSACEPPAEWSPWSEVYRNTTEDDRSTELVVASNAFHLMRVDSGILHWTSPDGLAWTARPSIPPSEGVFSLARLATAGHELHLLGFVRGRGFVHYATPEGGGGAWTLRSVLGIPPDGISTHAIRPIFLTASRDALALQWCATKRDDPSPLRIRVWRGGEWSAEPLYDGLRGTVFQVRVLPGDGGALYACIQLVEQGRSYLLFREFGPFPAPPPLSPEARRGAIAHAERLAQTSGEDGAEAYAEILALGRSGIAVLHEAMTRSSEIDRTERLRAWIVRAEKAWAARAHRAAWWNP